MLTKLNKKEKKKALAYIKKARKNMKNELNKEFILKKEKKFKNEVLMTVLCLRHTYNVVIALLESEPTTVNIDFAWVMRNHMDELTYRPR